MANCPHCGRATRSKDRFCIFCGKPLLSGLDKEKTEVKVDIEAEKEPSKEEKKKKKKDTELDEMEQTDILEEGEEEGKGKKKEDKKKDKKEAPEITPLSDDVRRQLEVVVDLKDIKKKKKRLREKFDDIQKLLDDYRYESDLVFTDEVNTKITALKNVKEELTLKENEIKAQMGGEFTYDVYQKTILEKKDQLNSLTKNFKLRKVDKDVFPSLKKEYINELEQAMDDLKNLKLSIRLWVAKLEAEKISAHRDLKLIEARLKSKEISKEDFAPKAKEFENQIRKFEHKIKVLIKYTKEKEN